MEALEANRDPVVGTSEIITHEAGYSDATANYLPLRNGLRMAVIIEIKKSELYLPGKYKALPKLYSLA